ncbi:MerR family transcriptional regulator [Rhodococcus erythropolis]|uniref:MerR family transcriptional regulator n=1 Tax=Rhodococcus erythropolis TaxID=1833 RepID=UPI001BE67C67|nr:MerR family transcriptional regulator [Rhodococcus erythropolis]MBT2266058.1 MerR family transcriptional regulator [Rhodococcus erythropolis]
MLIGTLSELTGCRPHQLRYYEAQGLLEAERSSNGYRRYSVDTVPVVQLIQSLLAVGVSVSDIRQILPSLNQKDERRRWTDLYPILRTRLNAIDRQIHDLHIARRVLVDCIEEIGDQP